MQNTKINPTWKSDKICLANTYSAFISDKVLSIFEIVSVSIFFASFSANIAECAAFPEV